MSLKLHLKLERYGPKPVNTDLDDIIRVIRACIYCICKIDEVPL